MAAFFIVMVHASVVFIVCCECSLCSVYLTLLHDLCKSSIGSWCFREIIDVTENNERSVCVMKIVNLCTVHKLIICFEWQKLTLIGILSTFLLFPSPTLYFLLLSFTGRWRDQIKGFVFSEAVAKWCFLDCEYSFHSSLDVIILS